MTDAEGEIKKATDTLLRLLSKEGGDKAEVIANYYASVAYWESKGVIAPELPDATIEVMKAEEARAFLGHRKNYAANKAAEEKKKEDAYGSKFFWAVGLVFIIYFPAYWSHVGHLTSARKARAKSFVIGHMQAVTGVAYSDEIPPSVLVNDYSGAYKKEFQNFLDARTKLHGQKVKFDFDQIDAGASGNDAQVIKINLPLENVQGQSLEYTVEDTSHGGKPPVIIATNELTVALPERSETPAQSPYPMSDRPRQNESPAVQESVPSLGGEDSVSEETDSQIQQQDYNSQRQYQTPQEDPDARRRADEYDRNTKRQWQQQNAKDGFMQTPSLGGDQDPGFEQ